MDTKLLQNWFKREQRDLPWRENRTPYAVWVSEMMLQQTQVVTVIPYFERWMKRFPTVKHLAEATIDEVIKLWEGLGYYSRARYLHEGAKQIVERHRGIFPKALNELQQIKGLGPYTVGAIRSFAFQERTPAVDGNVIRVLSRYYQIEEDMSKPSSVKKIWELAEKLLPEDRPWEVNEALIELGATVCTRKPKCHLCPIKGSCKGYSSGTTENLPYKSAKIKIEALYRAVAIIKRENCVLVRKAPKGEIMSDLHEFPYFEISAEGIEKQILINKLEDWLGCKLKWECTLPEVKHSFTRYRVKLTPMEFECMTVPKNNVDYQWIEKQKLSQLPFSSGHRRVLQCLIH